MGWSAGRAQHFHRAGRLSQPACNHSAFRTWDSFRNHLEKPPERRLERIGEINVGRLQRIGRDYKKSIDLTVEAKPEDWNLAHAEIPQRITRGLANQIVNALRLHQPPR